MEVSGGSIDALSDDNLTDILVRLDAVSVLRCRAVCKRWRRVATDLSFLAAHAASRPPEMIVETEYGFIRSTVPLSPTDMPTIAGDDDGHHRYLFEPRPLAADGNGKSADFELYASLDGLLVLKQWRYDPQNLSTFTYVICNPVRRQWANLPVPVPRRGATDVVTCGFYFHASSGEYRLLLHCVVLRDRRGHGERYCCVVSVGRALPRRLPHAPPSDDKRIPYYENPVSYRGTLHWLSGHPQGSSTGKMLAFDTASETFRLMPRPPAVPEPTTTETDAAMSDLLELDGELSVATIYGAKTLDIWALQDYEAEKWTLRHRLKVQPPPPPPPRSLGGRHPTIMGNAPRGSSAILVGFPPTRAVMAYSLNKDNNKVDKEINFGGLVSFKVFSESLVPHAFFDSPDTVPLNFSNPLLNERMGSAA
ncbi:unnamed protein product [Miscanthus lutarioriparius]|uniref:F-box domain-containing protein n=1 Tax=Miscanthus lutarioriparius TaxID=422564 RepID=A0A811SQ14_9POAL|nr:unnamed protein product [Miscanthus lutarioriparius]